MKILKPTINPFVNIAINIANNKLGFDKSSFQLIDFLINNQQFQYFDLNEKFLVNNDDYYNKLGSYFTNFFNTVFIMENSFNPQLINKMVSHGLLFDPFFRNENNEVVGDILFTRTELSSERNIFLFNLYLQQHGIENFTENIVKYNTLNKCIAQNKLDVAKFLLKHLSVNLSNENLETPIMFAKNLVSLEFLSLYHPNWGHKNIFGQDCSYFFSGIQDEQIKKDMLNFFFSELSKDNTSINNDTEYVRKRLEEALLNLVSKNATKVELQTFLKKYKLSDVDSLTNKNNRTLGHICISNEDFARFDLFPHTDLYHIDNNGYNIFTSLFSKNSFSSTTKRAKAKEIFLRCLKEPEKNITSKNINRLIEIPFYNYSSNPLPDWILKDHTLRLETLKSLNLTSNQIDFGPYINHSNSLTSEDKNKLYFDLFGSLIKKYDLRILEEDNIIEKLFTDRHIMDGKEYYFDKNNAEVLFLLLEKCENVGKINLNDFLSDKLSNINKVLFEFKNSFMVYNKEMYETAEELKNVNDNKFYQEVCKPFFEFLNDKKCYSIIQIINEDLINQTLKIDSNGDLNGFLKTFSYLKLNNKLGQKNIKSKNIKI